jgi:predicted transcriptional regulator
MPRGKRTSIPQAAQAKALADIGYQGSQIAEATGLPARTVDDIRTGETAGVR